MNFVVLEIGFIVVDELGILIVVGFLEMNFLIMDDLVPSSYMNILKVP